ncbi:hypothetical protein MPTK1_3g24760 [Marchantia polymorpha subsp. ruderalis]|uniref:Uncharacterized protein n=2 Tax=Marchantia polymorpha TaxID=3197 RepID=A0AAF6B4G4_MARPO|nr:hypothetical protein MARPO_0183s0008 [Marchantia polymorpha]BBN06898.1 hypothetical protein Mp_3g24760 [Marchantia polymorpha subsp. ruderalis]|eukprot:PTQ27803.1 hypothetical protein MARPO_0183s0008 [Marchantia polymorpha]
MTTDEVLVYLLCELISYSVYWQVFRYSLILRESTPDKKESAVSIRLPYLLEQQSLRGRGVQIRWMACAEIAYHWMEKATYRVIDGFDCID